MRASEGAYACSKHEASYSEEEGFSKSLTQRAVPARPARVAQTRVQVQAATVTMAPAHALAAHSVSPRQQQQHRSGQHAEPGRDANEMGREQSPLRDDVRADSIPSRAYILSFKI